jgi:hypothetical protein
VDALETELRALAKVEGCTAASQCRSVPVGATPCGGPRAYLPYCPRATDERALLAKARELERAEQEANRANQRVGTCEFLAPPTLELVGGACRAASAPGAPGRPAVRIPRQDGRMDRMN